MNCVLFEYEAFVRSYFQPHFQLSQSVGPMVSLLLFSIFILSSRHDIDCISIKMERLRCTTLLFSDPKASIMSPRDVPLYLLIIQPIFMYIFKVIDQFALEE